MQINEIVPGKTFTNAKGESIKIICVATYTKNDKPLVVYENLSDNEIYATKLDKFISSSKKNEDKSGEALSMSFSADRDATSVLIEFLDADGYENKYRIVSDNSDVLDDRAINQMAASLDLTIEEGEIEARIMELLKCIRTKSTYEINRRW